MAVFVVAKGSIKYLLSIPSADKSQCAKNHMLEQYLSSSPLYIYDIYFQLRVRDDL